MNDRQVLITGGSGGLGSVVTTLFVERGARVTAPAFKQSQRERMVEALGDRASEVTIALADLRVEAQVQAVLDGMERVDVVVHLVGGFAMGPTDEFAFEAFREQVDMNLTTTFLVLKHALRRMKAGGYGRIVTVGSRTAIAPQAQQTAYAATKAGVLAMTQAIAEETRELDITANCVLPSVIDTPANRTAMGDGEAHKWVTPRRLAEAILYLASEEAGDLRGTALPVFGRV